MDTAEAHERIQYVIDLASASQQIAQGLQESISEAHGVVAGNFGDHREMMAACQSAHHSASSAVAALTELMELAETFRGFLPQ